MSDFSYEIKKGFGTFSKEGNWPKELNLISWNGKEPKYDIRPWAPDHEKMGKGISLTEDELFSLGELIAKVRAGEA